MENTSNGNSVTVGYYTMNGSVFYQDYYSSGGDDSMTMMQTVMFVYLLPVLIVAGLLGNCLTMYVVRKTPLKNYSISVYMCAFTVSNILTLTLNSGIQWLDLVLERRHFSNYSEPGCRLWQFFIRLVTYSGIWFVVAMVIDRCITVLHPAKAREMCTVFVSKLSVVAILIGLTVLSVHAMWTYESSSGWCYIVYAEDDLHRMLWPRVSGILYSLLPLVLLFIIGSVVCCGIQCKSKPRDVRNSDLTCMTIAIAFLYLLFNTPATVINIIDSIAPETWRAHHDIRPLLDKARDVANCLAWVNYSALVFICILCSSDFRTEVKRLFCCLCHRKYEHCEQDSHDKCSNV